MKDCKQEDERTFPKAEQLVKEPLSRESSDEISLQKTKKKNRQWVRRGMAAVLTILLVLLAVVVFVFRDELSEENLQRTLGRENSVNPTKEAFTYETGAEQVFSLAGDGLAIASSSSVQLLNAKGQTVFKQVVSYNMPAVFGSSKQVLYCDLDGTGCLVADMDGDSVNLTTDDENRKILTADMNPSGWFAIVTAEPGYKGLVSVYNDACEKQYEWWSGSGYVLKAVVSPDNRSLAVLTIESSGTILHFFSLNKETPLAECTFDKTLVFDLSFLSNDLVRAVGDEGYYVVGMDGTIRGLFNFDGRYLLEYEFGSTAFTAIFVSEYRGGAGGRLITLNASGEVLAEVEMARDIVSMSAFGKNLLVMTSAGLVQYDSNLVSQYANETLMTARRAVLRPNGDILLLSAYSAERFSF